MLKIKDRRKILITNHKGYLKRKGNIDLIEIKFLKRKDRSQTNTFRELRGNQ